jgi:5-methylcytosine-specific restriction endonuclease McrA
MQQNMKCAICNKPSHYSDVILTDSRSVHQQCVQELQATFTEFDFAIRNLNEQLVILESAFVEISSLLNKFLGLFKKEIRKKEAELKHEINNCKKLIASNEQDRNAILFLRQEALEEIYSYWPSRPPDWEIRRRKAIIDWEKTCSVCSDNRAELHVHHIVPISAGGNHLQSNLEVLCKFCHQKMHGNNDFSIDYKSATSTYERKLEKIKTAIIESKKIQFKYRTYEGEQSSRKVKPASIKKIGQSQCVEGHCFLREEERRFAIKRMTYLKIVE